MPRLLVATGASLLVHPAIAESCATALAGSSSGSGDDAERPVGLSVAAIASSASAGAAWRSASKTSQTAKAANEALAMVLRPAFALHVPERDAAEHGPLPIKLASLSPYTALNVFAEIRGPQHERLASEHFPRVPGKPNDVLVNYNNAPTLLVALPPMVEGDAQRLSVLLRFDR